MGPMMRKRHEASGSGVASGRVANKAEGGTTVFFGMLQQLDVYARVDDDLAVRCAAIEILV